jgi:hypothetical protein
VSIHSEDSLQHLEGGGALHWCRRVGRAEGGGQGSQPQRTGKWELKLPRVEESEPMLRIQRDLPLPPHSLDR